VSKCPFMRAPSITWRLVAITAVAAVTATGGVLSGASATGQGAAPKPKVPAPVSDRACDKGSLPETVQGEAPAADYKSGRAAKGYTCNAREIGHFGTTGGYRVERYVDAAGHECAFYDSTLLFPTSAADEGTETTGTCHGHE